MMPTINSGDFIIYKPLKNKPYLLKQGGLIVMKHPLKKNTLLVKRIFKLQLPQIDVRGDNVLNSIDSRQFGVIHKDSVIGVVEHIFSQRK